MSIEGITSAQIIQKLKNIEQSSGKTAQTPGSKASDEVNISNDARLAQTLNRAFDEIEKAPDVREDRVEEVKQKLEDGAYDSPEVIDNVADQITDIFLG